MYLAEDIKSAIEAETCPKHDIHPVVEFIGNSYEIICCCNNFERLCRARIESMLTPEPELRLLVTSA